MFGKEPQKYGKEYVTINTSFDRAKKLICPPKRIEWKKVVTGIEYFTYFLIILSCISIIFSIATHDSTFKKGYDEGRSTCTSWNDSISVNSSWNDIGKSLVITYGTTILVVVGLALVFHGFRVI